MDVGAGAGVLLGRPVLGGVAIIADHASNAVPQSVDLGLSDVQLNRHIAWDIGVGAVAERLVAALPDCWAQLGAVSRLVVDLNREEDHPGLIPPISDGTVIPGNCDLAADARAQRVARYYRPYHDQLAARLAAHRPALIVSLHSFTPALASCPDAARPWDIGVLYNQDRRLVPRAIAALQQDGWLVGDQQPYSGTELNATMNRHAEANAIPYIGIEMRQDHVTTVPGQAQMAVSLAKMVMALVRP